jgi:hypothetical protein
MKKKTDLFVVFFFLAYRFPLGHYRRCLCVKHGLWFHLVWKSKQLICIKNWISLCGVCFVVFFFAFSIFCFFLPKQSRQSVWSCFDHLLISFVWFYFISNIGIVSRMFQVLRRSPSSVLKQTRSISTATKSKAAGKVSETSVRRANRVTAVTSKRESRTDLLCVFFSAFFFPIFSFSFPIFVFPSLRSVL